jgi:hypothetical protein
MIERINNGTTPTEIFREILASDPELNNYELARIFSANFERISGEAIQAIWYWNSGRRGGRMGGHDDDELDAILMEKLQEAGYYIHAHK